VALVVFLLRRRRRTATAPPPPPPRPAHELALEQLQQLRGAGLWQRGEIKAFHSQLSHIVREYLEGRFAIPALESTTDEILAALRRTDLAEEWRLRLRQMLQTADLVKFAKAVPPENVHEEQLGQAVDFVTATKPEEEPAQ
jgi:hypothetical protein